MIGSEQHFIDMFGPSRASALLDALTSAYGSARQIATAHGFVEGRTEPTVAFDLAIPALAALEELPGVRHTVVNGQHLWIVEESYALRVKQLGADYSTRNHTSDQQRRIDRQQPLDGLDPLIYLSTGPRISERTGLVIDFSIVKHYKPVKGRKRVEWAIDLDGLASATATSTTPVLPIPGLPSVPAAVVYRRGRKDQTGTDAT